MNLEKISARIRPRSGWEAVDLGLMVARTWFFPMLFLWCLVAIPVFLGLLLLLWEYPVWCVIVFWCLKPVYERLPLYYLSRRFFGESLSLSEWRSVLPVAFKQPIQTLLLRFSVSRSFDMPVILLEMQKGKVRRQRLNILKLGQGGVSSWFTLMGFIFEIVFYWSLIVLLSLFVPERYLDMGLKSIFMGDFLYLSMIAGGLYVISVGFFAPFYVAAGFSMYLNRRTQLEAWDIEINFKRLSNRLAELSKKGGQLCVAMVVGALVSGSLLLGSSQVAHAEALDTISTTELDAELSTEQQQVKRTLQAILDGDEFGKSKTEYYWKSIEDKKKLEKDEEETPEWMQRIKRLMERLFGGADALAFLPQWSALLIKWMIYIILAAGIIWLLYRYTDWLTWLQPSRIMGARKKRPRTTSIMGLDVHAESLPDDVYAELQSLIERHELRAALALMYRATLIEFIHRHWVDIPESATEQECLQRVQIERPEQDAKWLDTLTNHWLRTAYAHEACDVDTVRALAECWKQWKQAQDSQAPVSSPSAPTGSTSKAGQ